MHNVRKIPLKAHLLLTACLLLLCADPGLAEVRSVGSQPQYGLCLYGGRMTDNSMDDFIDSSGHLDFEDSYMFTLALARRVATYRDLASFEIEGQIAKHFKRQNHWEFNLLLAARWEAFYWDKYLDTSLAFGIGPSYATDIPEVEAQRSDGSEHLQVYLLVELEFALPSHPHVAVISRIHHRSNAFGIVAESGSSNVFALGLKFKF